jgi:hypothetical protein
MIRKAIDIASVADLFIPYSFVHVQRLSPPYGKN